MLKKFAASCVILLLVSALGTGCHKVPDASSSRLAIVGGDIPDRTSPALHSTVALVRKDGNGFSTVCSGILVAPNLVLTAAHCVESRKTPLLVLFGDADTDPLAQTVEIERSLTYKLDGSRFFPNFDIAWVKLAADAPTPWQAVELLRSSKPLRSIEGIAGKILLAGFGRTASVCDNSECMGRLYQVWTNLQHFFNEAHFVNLLVIGPHPGHGTCNGDSGGPAFVQINNRWLLAGVLNGKSPLLNSPNLWEKGVCESGEAIYNFAGAYIDWIEKTSGVKLKFDEIANPAEVIDSRLDDKNILSTDSTLEALLEFDNHNEQIWATVETLVSGFKNPANRYGATIEELVTQPELAAAAMRRWTEFNHVGLSFDFVVSSQKSNQLVDVCPIGELAGLKVLNLDSNKIENTTALGKLKNLVQLSLRNNYDYSRKRTIPWDFTFIQKLQHLETLDLSNNRGNLDLHSIAWDNLLKLKELKLSDNGRDLDLNAIPWEKLTQLKRLTIRNSLLSNIDALKRAKSLENIDLSRNTISSIAPLAELPELEYLDVSMNSISDFLPIKGLKKLTSLKALSNLQQEEFCPETAVCVYSPASFSDFESYCRFAFTLTPDDLSHWSGGATVMRLIQIAGVEDLRLEGCHDAQVKLSKFKVIDLGGSPNMPPIEDLRPLGPLTQLEGLNLANNDLRDIRPLAALKLLTSLDLSQNFVDDLTPLSSLTSLETLYLDGNLVTTLEPLRPIWGLTVFALDNPLMDDKCPLLGGSCYTEDNMPNRRLLGD